MLYPLIFLFACGDAEKTEAPTVQKAPPVEQKTPAQIAPKKMEKPAAKADAAAATGGNCDSQLKVYSDFVDEYIALMKKANKGDASAMQKYPALMKKAEKSSKELEVLHKDGKIDADCWKKYNKINSKS